MAPQKGGGAHKGKQPCKRKQPSAPPVWEPSPASSEDDLALVNLAIVQHFEASVRKRGGQAMQAVTTRSFQVQGPGKLGCIGG